MIPVIPCYAKIDPQSRISPDSRGKAPGRPTRNGTWVGFAGWQEYQATPETLLAWERAGASIGIRCGKLAAIDVDIVDEALSRAAYKALAGQQGLPPNPVVRIGQKPKFLLPVVITDGPAPNRLLTFHKGMDEHRIDVLGVGRQFVMHGLHAKTKELYRWIQPAAGGVPATRGVPRANRLPRLTLAQFGALLDALSRGLEAAGCEAGADTHLSVGRTHTGSQEDLEGDQAAVESAVSAIPNNTRYGDWILIGHALKATSAKWPDAGRDLWLAWSATWTGEGNAGDAEAKWESFRPPFSVGADFLYDRAAENGWAKSESAAADFADVAGTVPPAIAATDPKVLARQTDAHFVSAAAQWSDAALALRFTDKHADDLIFVPERGIWYRHNEVCWLQDAAKVQTEKAIHTFLTREMKRLPSKNKQLPDRLMSSSLQANVERLSRKFRAVSQSTLDSDLWALNTPSGVYDLRTGAPTTDASCRFTRATAVAPTDGGTPLFDRFLADVCGEDADLVGYLWRAMGLTIRGSPIEPLMFFLYGSGGNGKSVLTTILFDILGDLATVADEKVFLRKRSEQHPTAVASLAGARIAGRCGLERIPAEAIQRGRAHQVTVHRPGRIHVHSAGYIVVHGEQQTDPAPR